MPVQSGMSPGRSSAPRLAILGRDGVINERYVPGSRSVSEWRAIPGSLRAIGRLTSANFHLVVVANQSGASSASLDDGALARIHARMSSEVAREGGRIAAIFYCPHEAGEECACRMPKPGLLRDIAARLEVGLQDVPFLSDSLDDLDAARAVGARPILLRTGLVRMVESSEIELRGIDIYDNLAAAASALIGQAGPD